MTKQKEQTAEEYLKDKRDVIPYSDGKDATYTEADVLKALKLKEQEIETRILGIIDEVYKEVIRNNSYATHCSYCKEAFERLTSKIKDNSHMENQKEGKEEVDIINLLGRI